jgi:predicted component of type VI protein secretion system
MVAPVLLTLEVAGPQASFLGEGRRKQFTTEGGTIGRIEGNDWVLPGTFVSSHHAAIQYADRMFFVVDTNSANGVYLNSLAERLEAGRRYALQSGDRLFIEPFEILVSVATSAEQIVAPPATAVTAPPAGPAPPVEPARAAAGSPPAVVVAGQPAQAASPAALRDFTALLAAVDLNGVEVTPAVAANFSRVVTIVVGGLMEALRAREEMKREFQLQVTSIQPRENNPLKFSASPEDALHNLFLVKRNSAFLTPLEAFDDAFEDVRAHQQAMLMALRSAFQSMLGEFDPERLEQRFERYLKPGGLPPKSAKQRYWELYRESYQDAVSEADASFRRLFGEAFSKAYDDHVQRLRKERRATAK